MTATVQQHQADQRRAERGSAMAQAAIRYAQHGWPVLPGTVFDGRRYTAPATGRATDGLRPLLPRDAASTDMRTLAQWWRVTTPLVPSVLIRTGRRGLGVADLAVEAVQTTAFRDGPGPVILRPDQGRAYFLVDLGESVAPPERARPTVVEPVRSGAWIAAPPTRTGVGGVSWLASPQGAGWEPLSAAALAKALLVALPHVDTAGWVSRPVPSFARTSPDVYRAPIVPRRVWPTRNPDVPLQSYTGERTVPKFPIPRDLCEHARTG